MPPSSQVPHLQVRGLCIGSCRQALLFLLLACLEEPKFDSDNRCVCPAVLHAGTMPEIFSGERNPDNGALRLAKQAPYTKMFLVLSSKCSDSTCLTKCRLIKH